MRLIGGLLTVTAFFLIGTGSAREIRAELRALESVSAFLRELSRKLTWSRAPLQELFTSCREPFLEQCGFLPVLKNTDPKQYTSGWSAALACLPLSEDALRALNELGKGLGRVSLETQKEQLLLCISVLDALHAEKKANAKDKQRSAVTLWTLAGLLIALLLI